MSPVSPRAAGAAALSLLALTGCWLTPAPTPPPTTSAQTQTAAPPIATGDAPVPAVTASGFSPYERAAQRVRNLGCGGVSSGSGFAIADHVFVTNRHVVGGAALLQVSKYDGRDITVNGVGAVVIADLALVSTKEALPATLRPEPLNPPVGAAVTAVGYTLGGELTTTSGHVLKYGPDPLGSSSFQVKYNDAPIEHGSSGSPLVDSSGKLVSAALHRWRRPVLRRASGDPQSGAQGSLEILERGWLRLKRAAAKSMDEMRCSRCTDTRGSQTSSTSTGHTVAATREQTQIKTVLPSCVPLGKRATVKVGQFRSIATSPRTGANALLGVEVVRRAAEALKELDVTTRAELHAEHSTDEGLSRVKDAWLH